MLCEAPTFGTNGRFGSPGKKISINFSKADKKICLSLLYNVDNSYLFFNEKTILITFKAENKRVNFPIQFCVESISNGFSATESREVSLNENVYDFSIEDNSINKSDILNFHKYVINEDSIKLLALLCKSLLYY